MDRTHSIMRIATTASPVSGADVREKTDELRLMIEIDRAARLISRTWKTWKMRKQNSGLDRGVLHTVKERLSEN